MARRVQSTFDAHAWTSRGRQPNQSGHLRGRVVHGRDSVLPSVRICQDVRI